MFVYLFFSDEVLMIGSEVGDMREKAEIDSKNARFPYCIVWTPLPCITWLIPPIGHMGIAYSTGVIRDFAGPYYVSEDNLAFGSTTRYLQLEPELIKGLSWRALWPTVCGTWTRTCALLVI